MRTEPNTQRPVTTYTAPVAREVLIAEALGAILSGRPWSAGARAPLARARPSSTEAGIGEILAGPAGA